MLSGSAPSRKGLLPTVVLLGVLVGWPAGQASAVPSLSTSITIASSNAGCTNIGTAQAQCATSASTDFGNGTIFSFTGQGQERASFGSLGTSASITGAVSSGGTNTGIIVQTAADTANFGETLTVHGAPVNGQLSVLVHTHGDGHVVVSTPAPQQVITNVFANTLMSFQSVGGNQTFVVPNGDGSFDLRAPFQTSSGGVATAPFALGLASSIRCIEALGVTCTAVADFFNSLDVTAVQVLDLQGNVVAGATLTSESGHDLQY